MTAIQFVLVLFLGYLLYPAMLFITNCADRATRNRNHRRALRQYAAIRNQADTQR